MVICYDPLLTASDNRQNNNHRITVKQRVKRSHDSKKLTEVE